MLLLHKFSNIIFQEPALTLSAKIQRAAHFRESETDFHNFWLQKPFPENYNRGKNPLNFPSTTDGTSRTNYEAVAKNILMFCARVRRSFTRNERLVAEMLEKRLS